MEDVLDLYTQPYDPLHPVVCMNEATRQLIEELCIKLPMIPSHPQTYDHQYKRVGVCNLFIFVEPLAGWRSVEVRDFRRKEEWVNCLKDLLENKYKDADYVRIISDNLNTHNPAAFYEFFPPDVAKSLLDRLEFHFTPKHASWLNIAEIEINVLSGQCLKKRIPSKEMMVQQVSAWVVDRNKKFKKVNWQFTTKNARIKLQKLYPSFIA